VGRECFYRGINQKGTGRECSAGEPPEFGRVETKGQKSLKRRPTEKRTLVLGKTRLYYRIGRETGSAKGGKRVKQKPVLQKGYRGICKNGLATKMSR